MVYISVVLPSALLLSDAIEVSDTCRQHTSFQLSNPLHYLAEYTYSLIMGIGILQPGTHAMQPMLVINGSKTKLKNK
jgi:hypothetical protein